MKHRAYFKKPLVSFFWVSLLLFSTNLFASAPTPEKSASATPKKIAEPTKKAITKHAPPPMQPIIDPAPGKKADKVIMPEKPMTEMSEYAALPLQSDFRQILAHTYENNPEVASSAIEQKVTAEGVPKALSGWRPTFEAKASRNVTKNHPASLSNPDRIKTNSGEVSATYNIFEGGRTVKSTDAAEAAVRSGMAQFDAKEQQTLFEAAQAYFQLLKAKEEVTVNKSQEDRLQKQLRFVKAQADVGEKSRTDLEEARTDYVKSVNRRIVAEQTLEVRKAVFTQVTQTKPDIDRMKLPVLPPELFPKSAEEAIEQAMNINPAVLQAKETLTSRQDSIGVARASLLPRVDFSASAKKAHSNAPRNTRSNQNTYQGVFEMTVPIYGKGGSDWAELRKTTQEKNKSRKELMNQRTKSAREAAEAWAQWDYTKRQIPYLQTQVKSANILVDGRRREYEAGEKVLLAVTEAEDKLIQAETSLLNAKQDERIQACRLLTSVGRFSARALNIPINRYKIEEYYREARGQWIGGTGESDAEG
ncbi:TolC family outer membrane protein [Alphaproteobacteria bacterium]|nr:TolC family outer membrane protein [Alphaproteobacteria bacterium]